MSLNWCLVMNNTLVKLTKRIEELERALERDALTGAYNRNFFYGNLNLKPYISGRLYFIDLDGFKKINDSRGHVYGDQVLTRFAFDLTMCLSNTDLLIRYAGDEFIIVTAKKRLRLSSNLSFSCGSVKICNNTTKDELLETADKRMYRNKNKC